MATKAMTINQVVNTSPYYSRQLRNFTLKALATLFTFLIAFVYLLPLGVSAITSTQTEAQMSNAAILPVSAKTFHYIAPDGTANDLPIFTVPLDGGDKQLAMLKKGRAQSTFVDPANPTAEPLVWVGKWQTLKPIEFFDPHLENFGTAWNMINFPKLFGNTAIIALLGVIGTLLSCIAVGYAFARFPIPGKNILFLVLIGTIILPRQVTLIPTFAFFSAIGWVGTFAPLIVPHFFANAYNVFLLRQYFMTLPRDLDEAAMIDGANPLGILLRVIIPQSWPVIISVAVFHFVFAWNDFFGPLLYLGSNPDLQPISVGVMGFNLRQGTQPQYVQAVSLLAMILPIIIFIFAQRFFMRGVVITGVEK